jgi:hypothetical protein
MGRYLAERSFAPKYLKLQLSNDRRFDGLIDPKQPDSSPEFLLDCCQDMWDLLKLPFARTLPDCDGAIGLALRRNSANKYLT